MRRHRWNSLLAERQAPPVMGSRTAVAAPAADPANHLSIAYERGRIARETGAQRRAVPGEYARRTPQPNWKPGWPDMMARIPAMPKAQPNPGLELLTTTGAAARLGFSYKTVIRLWKEGKIERVRSVARPGSRREASSRWWICSTR